MSPKTLHTIGYEGSTIDRFLATLESVGINLVIDVRDFPLSRKPGFSKSALSDWLASRDIAYLHLKGLGDPKPGRIAAREGRYSDFQRIFTAHLRSDVAKSDMLRGVVAATGKMACLLCFERDHSHCHRCIVAKEMARRGGFKLVHLGIVPAPAVKSKYETQSAHDRSFAHHG